jgi:hypothetical protein
MKHNIRFPLARRFSRVGWPCSCPVARCRLVCGGRATDLDRAGANAFWSTPGNWSPAGPPVDGDRLTFPSTASRLVNTNDLPGLRAQGIVFNGPAGGVTLRGNILLVTADITAIHLDGFDTMDCNVVFPTGGSIIAGQPGTLIVNGDVLVGGSAPELFLFNLSFTNFDRVPAWDWGKLRDVL